MLIKHEHSGAIDHRRKFITMAMNACFTDFRVDIPSMKRKAE